MVYYIVKKRLVNETDMKSTIVPTRGAKHTFQAPLTRNECSDIDCLSWFVAWLALHVRKNVVILQQNCHISQLTIVSTIGDKRTLQPLQHKKGVFIRCLPVHARASRILYGVHYMPRGISFPWVCATLELKYHCWACIYFILTEVEVVSGLDSS